MTRDERVLQVVAALEAAGAGRGQDFQVEGLAEAPGTGQHVRLRFEGQEAVVEHHERGSCQELLRTADLERALATFQDEALAEMRAKGGPPAP